MKNKLEKLFCYLFHRNFYWDFKSDVKTGDIFLFKVCDIQGKGLFEKHKNAASGLTRIRSSQV
jgi:hypothetical protein